MPFRQADPCRYSAPRKFTAASQCGISRDDAAQPPSPTSLALIPKDLHWLFLVFFAVLREIVIEARGFVDLGSWSWGLSLQGWATA